MYVYGYTYICVLLIHNTTYRHAKSKIADTYEAFEQNHGTVCNKTDMCEIIYAAITQ